MNAAQIDAAQRERLAAALQSSLPTRPGLELLELAPLGTGWETDLYRVAVRFGAPATPTDEHWVLRQYYGTDHHQRATRDFQLLQRLQRLDISVPVVLQVIENGTKPGSSTIVMEHVAGPNLRQRLADLPDEAILAAIDSMAELLAQIHRAPWRQALPAAAPVSPGAALQGMRATVERFQLAEFEPHLAWLEQSPPQIAEPPVLLHNDFHPENLLRREAELVAIDWSFAAVGDYRMDLAWTVLLVGTMLGERFRQPMLRSYEQQRRSPVEHFEYFEALMLGSRLLTILTWLDERVEIPVHRLTRRSLRGDYKIHVLNPYRRLVQVTGLELPSIEAL